MGLLSTLKSRLKRSRSRSNQKASPAASISSSTSIEKLKTPPLPPGIIRIPLKLSPAERAQLTERDIHYANHIGFKPRALVFLLSGPSRGRLGMTSSSGRAVSLGRVCPPEGWYQPRVGNYTDWWYPPKKRKGEMKVKRYVCYLPDVEEGEAAELGVDAEETGMMMMC